MAEDYSVNLTFEVEIPIADRHTATALLEVQVIIQSCGSAIDALQRAQSFATDVFHLSERGLTWAVVKIDIVPATDR